MGKIEIHETFDAPADKVFAIFTDLPSASENITAITAMEMLTEGPVGKGTRWRETRVMFGKEHTEEMWIDDFRPGQGYTVHANSCGCLYETDFSFTPAGAGATEVTMRFNAKPLTLMARLMIPLGWLFAGTMKKCMRQDFDDIRRKLASRA